MIFLTIISGKVEKSCLLSPSARADAILLGLVTWQSCDPHQNKHFQTGVAFFQSLNSNKKKKNAAMKSSENIKDKKVLLLLFSKFRK